MLKFLFGVLVGAPLGLITTALLTVAKQADKYTEKAIQEEKKNGNTRSM